MFKDIKKRIKSTTRERHHKMCQADLKKKSKQMEFLV